jgi:hypothetical protein
VRCEEGDIDDAGGGLLRELAGHAAAGVVDQRGGERLRLLAQPADVCAVDCVAGPLADALVLASRAGTEAAFSERRLKEKWVSTAGVAAASSVECPSHSSSSPSPAGWPPIERYRRPS